MHDFIVLHLPPYLKTENIFYLLVAKKPFKKISFCISSILFLRYLSYVTLLEEVALLI